MNDWYFDVDAAGVLHTASATTLILPRDDGSGVLRASDDTLLTAANTTLVGTTLLEIS